MKILEKSTIGDLELTNRMVMAPMTRSRADENGVINKLAVLYYGQRAGAGLIISEAINISEQALGMPNTPGIYSRQQVNSWKEVTDAVHRAGGKIFAQLNHAGRVAHSLNRKGHLPVAPSALAIEVQEAYTPRGQKAYEVPLALSVSDIKQIIQDYKSAAINALDAGFDGIELHAALGYLPNQFLMESSNRRTDDYGGSIENRSRFILETMKEIIGVVGPARAGIKLSPSVVVNNMLDSNPSAVYGHLISKLNEQPLAYIHLMQALFPLDELPHYPKNPLESFAHLTDKTIITNGGYNRESAEDILQHNKAQFVSFGSLFLANPDLPTRFELNAPLNQPDRATMYIGGDEKGYTDYPGLDVQSFKTT
ncbi:alkene reductase [Dyadobacter sp. SG02]|uniref:alkene reductase n=1 Tax=Dyadobacter sp. SG02 TaxID=1855291 RepID=UPI000B882119|nr:alkene reductase [Dyadobacter sp. SG02]